MNTRKHIAAEKGGTARFIISTDRRDRFCFNLQIKEKEIEHINKHYPFDI